MIEILPFFSLFLSFSLILKHLLQPSPLFFFFHVQRFSFSVLAFLVLAAHISLRIFVFVLSFFPSFFLKVKLTGSRLSFLKMTRGVRTPEEGSFICLFFCLSVGLSIFISPVNGGSLSLNVHTSCVPTHIDAHVYCDLFVV